MKVPFLELKPAYEELREEFDAAYHRVMDSGWYLLGQELESFEAEYAAFCQSKYCVGVANGLDALHLALRAFGVGSGDEVIVPAHTYIATWLAVTHAGGIPVAVEPDEQTYYINPSAIEEAITPRTKGIIPVHLYGQPADMDPILEIAARRGLFVLEDAAQAQGARYKGRRVGSLGHAAAHSFYPGKNLGAFADGGAVTTCDAQLADRVRVLRNYGSRVKYHNEVAGFNSRLEELQAAFLRVKLAHLDGWNERRRKLANQYIEALASCGSITCPLVPTWAEVVWHLFVVRHAERDRLQATLREHDVHTQIHYPIPPHLSAAYADNAATAAKTRWCAPNAKALAVAAQLANEVLSLPMGPHITPAHVDGVAAAILHAVV